MESVSGGFFHAYIGTKQTVSIVEAPLLGKPKCKRVTTTGKADDGSSISVLIEELENGKLLSRHYEQYVPVRSTTKELFASDGTLISSETERRDGEGRLTKIVLRGSGKSSTTRIICGEVEARATERSIIIESPRASYSFQPFDGRWHAYYKDMNMKLDLKANFLKSPDSYLDGPDGLKLVFKNGRLVDLLLSRETINTSLSPTNQSKSLILD